jgi:hypothetical protein
MEYGLLFFFWNTAICLSLCFVMPEVYYWNQQPNLEMWGSEYTQEQVAIILI